MERMDAARALFLKTLGEMTAKDLQRPRRVEDYEITPEWVCFHLMQHEAEHRGQIAELYQRALMAKIQ